MFAVVSVLNVTPLLKAAYVLIKPTPHPMFRAPASWACAPRSRAALQCLLSPSLERPPFFRPYLRDELRLPGPLHPMLLAEGMGGNVFPYYPLPTLSSQ